MSDLPDRIWATRFYAECSTLPEPDFKRFEYLNADVAMTWQPIAEAGLRDGELVDCWVEKHKEWVKGSYSSEYEGFWVPTKNGTGILRQELVTHILRIKPPTAARG